MKKILSLFIFLMSLVSCQEELLVKRDYPIEPITKRRGEPSSEKDSAISKWDALKIVEPITNKYPDRWVDVSDKVIPAGTVLEYSSLGIKMDLDSVFTLQSPEYESWLVVLGPDPKANGGQEQSHYFINTSSGEYCEQKVVGRVIVEWDNTRNVYADNGIDNSSLKTKVRPTSRSSSPTQWAVILSGGGDMYSNYDRYWNDCQYIYNALTQELGYPSHQIFCLVSDGLNTGYDRRIGPYTFDNSPADFDNDGFSDIDYPATKSWLSTIFTLLSSRVSDGDEVFLFVTDHGELGGNVVMWNGELLSASELNSELNKLGQDVTIDIVMGQCYSGAFVSALSRSNRTISTAVDFNEVSYGNAAYGGYDYFLRYWTDAIYNANPSVSGTHSNGDGYLSLFELFEYGEDNPSANAGYETPQRYASPTILFWGHDLEGNHFEPYITGNDYASTNSIGVYTHSGIPTSLSCTWSCSNNLSIVSSNSSSANIRGNGLLPSQYVSLGGIVAVSFNDLGENWSVSKTIDSIWKPGPYTGYNYITRNYNSYYLVDYLSVGTYPGTSNYQWFSDSSSWNIVSQDGAYVTVQSVPAGSINVSVVFEDPFGGTIYISDEVL